MGGQNCDLTVVRSSIALLQERFRQLEQAKEMRQQRKLLRLHAKADQPPKAYESSTQTHFFHSELILPPTQLLQGSHCVQQNSRNKTTDLQNIEILNSENLWSRNTVMQITSNFDEPDVDTSLHL